MSKHDDKTTLDSDVPFDVDTPDETPVAEGETELDLHATYGLPDDWSQEKAQAWLEGADLDQPLKTETGVMVYDPERATKPMADWSTEELLAQLKGELQKVPEKLSYAAIKEYKRRSTDIDPAWDNGQILAFYRQGTVPPKTASGVWVTDVTRAQRKPADWTNQELHAWTQGEIKALGASSDAKLARELNRRFDLKAKDESVETVLKTYQYRLEQAEDTRQQADQLEESAPSTGQSTTAKTPTGALSPMSLSFIQSTLKRYVEDVRPGRPVPESVGGNAQRQLENLFSYVLRLEGPALLEALDAIKAVVKAHRDDVFSPSSAYRFVHLLKGDHKARQRHVNFIELFRIVTDPQARVLKKQTDIQGMLRGQPANRQDSLYDYFRNYA